MNQEINNEKLKETSCTDEERNRKKAFQNIDTGFKNENISNLQNPSDEVTFIPSKKCETMKKFIKNRYEKDYNLSKEQLKLIRQYFDKLQNEELIEKNVFKNHLKTVLKQKKMVKVNENDIVNALSAIDS